MKTWVAFVYGLGTVSVTAPSKFQALVGLAALGYNKVTFGLKVQS